MERAPKRVLAAVLCQPVGHRPENPDVMYDSGRDVWAPELLARRPTCRWRWSRRTCTTSTASGSTRVQRVARLCVFLPDADAGHAGRYPGALVPNLRRYCFTGAERRGDGLSQARAAGAEGTDDQAGAHLSQGASTCGRDPLRRGCPLTRVGAALALVEDELLSYSVGEFAYRPSGVRSFSTDEAFRIGASALEVVKELSR